MSWTIRRLRGDKKGVTSLEYGLIAAMIAAAVASSVVNIGTKARTAFTTVGSSMSAANR